MNGTTTNTILSSQRKSNWKKSAQVSSHNVRVSKKATSQLLKTMGEKRYAIELLDCSSVF